MRERKLGLIRWYRFLVLLLPYLAWTALMPLTDQYDLLLNAWQAHHINRGYWNLYAHLSRVPNFAVPGHPPAPYPFGFYLLYAGWLEVLQGIGLIDYTTWRSPLVVREFPASVLALKLPYFAAHLAIGAILSRAAPLGWRWAAWAIWAWSLSPAYLLFMGQNDLPLALLMVAATALGAHAIHQQQTGNLRWQLAAFASMTLLGVGATYKTAPLMLAPPFALLIATRWRGRAALVALPVAIFALSALPFLDTPAFVNGALFNPEGMRLFAGVQLFAQTVPLFLVAYMGLLILLATRPLERRQPLDVWLVGAGVFSALFLFAWTQFYWQAWLTPLLIGLVVRDAPRRALWLGVWLICEVTFGMLLFMRHRELSWGLLRLGSNQFQLIQFETVQLLSPLPFQQPFEALWGMLRISRVAALLGPLVGAAVALVQPTMPSLVRVRHSFVLAALGVPVIACVSAAVVVLVISRDAVAQDFDRRIVGEVRLSAEQTSFTQVLSPALPSANGVLLWSTLLPTVLPLEACAHTDTGTFCVPSRPVQSIHYNFNGYAFWFGATPSRTMHAITFRLIAPVETNLVVQVGRRRPQQGEDHHVVQGKSRIEGVVRMTLLHTFDPTLAGADIAAWLTRDWRTWLLLGIAAASIVGISRRIAFGHHRRFKRRV